MAYDNYLSERISAALRNRSIAFKEKHMFGGVAFMVDEKMCVGVMGESLMARIVLALEFNPRAKSSKKKK